MVKLRMYGPAIRFDVADGVFFPSAGTYLQFREQDTDPWEYVPTVVENRTEEIKELNRRYRAGEIDSNGKPRNET